MMSRGGTGLEGATVALADHTVVLRRVTLLAEPGELLGIVGPSGSGKSTVLRAIAGLEKVSEGRVLIDGRDAGPVGTREVSMVFQDSHLIPFLDAARNLAFPLEVAKVPRDQSRARVQRQAARFGVGRLLGRRPDALSPGERARVSLGRATVRDPSAFLLDEPFAHLDSVARVEMRHEVRRVVTQTGVTTFFVTHDTDDAMSICDRVAVLVAGRVLQIGTGRELYDHPVDAVVADLVAPGRLALLPAQLVVSRGVLGFRVGERVLPTWEAPPAGLAGDHGRDVLIGVRPEQVHERPDPADGTLAVTVRTVEVLGAHTTVGLELGAHVLIARFGGGTSARPGDRLTVGVDVSDAPVFDAVTGAALR